PRLRDRTSASTSSLLQPRQPAPRILQSSRGASSFLLGSVGIKVARAQREIQTGEHRIPIEVRLYALRPGVCLILLRGYQVQYRAETRLIARQRRLRCLLRGLHLRLRAAYAGGDGLQVVVGLPYLELALPVELVARCFGLIGERLRLARRVRLLEAGKKGHTQIDPYRRRIVWRALRRPGDVIPLPGEGTGDFDRRGARLFGRARAPPGSAGLRFRSDDIGTLRFHLVEIVGNGLEHLLGLRRRRQGLDAQGTVDREPDDGRELPARFLELAAAARKGQLGLSHLRFSPVDIRGRRQPRFPAPPRGIEGGLGVLQRLLIDADEGLDAY